MARIWQRKYAVLFAVAAIVLAAVQTVAQPTKTLTVPEADTPPKIDGALDDPCWKDAPKGNGFMLRSLGRPATEQTDFYVCYDEKNIYFAFYCHDSQPDKIKGTQTERDSDLRIDDCVQIYLDTYHDHRTAEEFFVNSLGTQRDERKRGTADKISWKGDWHAAAKRVADGWTAEMEIPWAILNYKPGATSMGLNVRRDQPRLGEVSDWTALNDGDQVMLYGDLEGMTLPTPPTPPLQIMPYAMATVGDGSSGRMGLDIKKRFGEDSEALLTAFPDFGTIENAAKSIDFSYTAHRYSDNRPFFLEASSIFASSYIYTHDIPNFDVGAKVFGKQGKTTYGLMGCSNNDLNRTDSMAVLMYNLPSLTTARLNMVGRHDDIVDNDVYTLKLSSQPTENTSLWVRGGKSITGGPAGDGSSLAAGASVSLSRWSFDASYGHATRDFNPADSYVDYPGSASYDAGVSYDVAQPGQKIRSWGIDSGMDRTGDGIRGMIEQSADVGFYISLANHTSFSIGHDWGQHIKGYEGPDEPPTPPYAWFHDSENSLSYGFRQDDRYRSGGLSYYWGRENGGPSKTIDFECGFLPRERFSTSISLKRAVRDNVDEKDFTGWLGTLGARYEFTAEKSVAARLRYRTEKGVVEGEPVDEKGTNLTISYQQRLRQGLDIFALFGDYNVDNTVNKFAIKVIAAM